MIWRVFNIATVVVAVSLAAFLHQLYFPARDGAIYACGVIAGQDSISGESREAGYCAPWRERAESVGFTPFNRK